MRYRLMASYRGSPYQAGVGPWSSEITLFAAFPPPEEHGFLASAGHWRKQLRVNDIDALWESRPVGSYHGEPCLVLDDLGDRLHIAYLGMDEQRARQLGYWQVDRGVFEVVIPRAEVVDLAEERHEFPLKALMATMSAPGPPGPGLSPPGLPALGPAAPGLAAPGLATGMPAEPPAARIPEPSFPWPEPPVRLAAGRPESPATPAGAAAWHGSPDDDGNWYGSPRQDGGPYNGTAESSYGPGSAPANGAAPSGIGPPDGPPNGASPANWPPGNGAVAATGYAPYNEAPEPPGWGAPADPTVTRLDLAAASAAPAMPLSAPPLAEPWTAERWTPEPWQQPDQQLSEARPPADTRDSAPLTQSAVSQPQSPDPLPSAPAQPADDRAQSAGVVRGRRAARKPRISTQSMFAELLDLANIPRSSYAVDEEVSGAMCLVKTTGGFEVFSCTNDSRHEVRFFEDEEAAYFYLFGVLAAEALRNGKLAPK